MNTTYANPVESTMNERLTYLAELEIEHPSYGLLDQPSGLKMDETKPEAYVDGGGLVSFVAGVSEEHRSDVLNSTLLAQLAANKAFDREKQTVDWYRKYREVLEKVGWVVENFDFTRFKAGGSTFDGDAVVASVLEAIATKDDKKIVKQTIDAVRALDDGDGRLTIWNQESHELDKGNFQISVCAEADDVVAMKLGAFYFSTKDNVTRVLWFRFSSSKTEFYKGAQTVTLNEEVYEQVRKVVLKKLGKSAEDYVGNLDI